VQQKIAYENGAIIVWQSDGMHIKASPQFNLLPSGTAPNTALNITFTLISLYGKSASSAERTEGVHLKLYYTQSQQHPTTAEPTWTPADNYTVWINITSDYYKAWYNYFTNTLEKKLQKGAYTVTYMNANYQPITEKEATNLADKGGLFYVSVAIYKVTSFLMNRANLFAGIGDVNI
jgi:hypothetical protein